MTAPRVAVRGAGAFSRPLALRPTYFAGFFAAAFFATFPAVPLMVFVFFLVVFFSAMVLTSWWSSPYRTKGSHVSMRTILGLALALVALVGCSSTATPTPDVTHPIVGGALDAAVTPAGDDAGAPSQEDDAGTTTSADAGAPATDAGTQGQADTGTQGHDAGEVEDSGAPGVDAGPVIEYCISSFGGEVIGKGSAYCGTGGLDCALGAECCITDDGHGTGGVDCTGYATIACDPDAGAPACAGFPQGQFANPPSCVQGGTFAPVPYVCEP